MDPVEWIWTICRQSTPGPGGLLDKATKGKRARRVPIIAPLRPLIGTLLHEAGPDPMARVFTGPRGGRITTAVLRDATHWDDVVTHLGHEHLRRHDSFPHCPDLLVNSMYDPTCEEVAPFEEFMGSHGGLGGPQTKPFAVIPVQWSEPAKPIVGVEAMHEQLRDWLADSRSRNQRR